MCIKGLILESGYRRIADTAGWEQECYTLPNKFNTQLLRDMHFAVRSCHSSLWPTVTALDMPHEDIHDWRVLQFVVTVGRSHKDPWFLSITDLYTAI